jgi:hypothetical protein
MGKLAMDVGGGVWMGVIAMDREGWV